MLHQPVARSLDIPWELRKDTPVLPGNTPFVLLQKGYKPCGKIIALPHGIWLVFKKEFGFISYQDIALHFLHMLICFGKFMEKQIIVLIQCLGKPSMSPPRLSVEHATVLPRAGV